MASIIRVKRSTGTTAPASLNYGEVAYTVGSGTQANLGQRLFIGDASNTPQLIGGEYYTDLMSHAPGSIAAAANAATASNGFIAILDQNRKVDQWNVDNLTIDGNTFSSTNTDGDINLDPNGSGEIVIPDDTFLTFGTSKDSKIEYDENGTDQLNITGADVRINITTESLDKDTGALIVEGGVGIEKNLNVGGSFSSAGITTVNLPDNTDNAYLIQEGTNKYVEIDTTDNSELLALGNDLASVNIIVEDNAANAFLVKEGTSEYIALDTTNGSELITFSTANIDFDNDVNIDGGDLTTNVTGTFNLLNTNATTVNFAGAATTLVIGNASGNFNVDATGNTDLGGDLNVDGDDLTTSQTTFNLLNTTATTVNAFGAATAIDIGATTGITTVNNNLDVDLDLNVDGGDITTNQATFNLLNTNATTVNAFGAATNIDIGAATGTVSINNATVDLDGDLNVDGGDITTNLTGTFNLLETNATTINFAGAATDLNIGAATGKVTVRSTDQSTSVDTGALEVDGGVGIAKNLYVGGDINHTGTFGNIGGAIIDNVGISSNVISTRAGGGNVLYIDPYPDGLSNEGLVVVKGDLQVDGTTTTVNSTSVTANEAIFKLGDVTSVRTVTAEVATGVSTITVDSIVGINTGDVISGDAAIPGATSVSSYDPATKIITLSANTTAGITTTTQLTVTHAYDTNTDRGISFNYNTSSGSGNNKLGFFGYNDSAGENSSAPERAWTYIPDATNSNSVMTGTRGNLDIKGIYYQTGDFFTHGIVYFDSNGLQTSSASPSSNTITSTQILTAVTEIVLTLDSTHSFTEGAQITQLSNSSAYGMVKTTTTSSNTVTLIGVQGTFDTTNDLVADGTTTGRNPTLVSTTYTDKPIWTSTLDGGTF